MNITGLFSTHMYPKPSLLISFVALKPPYNAIAFSTGMSTETYKKNENVNYQFLNFLCAFTSTRHRSIT